MPEQKYRVTVPVNYSLMRPIEVDVEAVNEREAIDKARALARRRAEAMKRSLNAVSFIVFDVKDGGVVEWPMPGQKLDIHLPPVDDISYTVPETTPAERAAMDRARASYPFTPEPPTDGPIVTPTPMDPIR